jgi:hypothetical protein
MKKRFGASVTMLVALTLGATMLTGLSSTGSLSATARQHDQTLAAHAAFVKDMSSHAPMMRAPVSPSVLASSPGVTESASVNWSGFADTPTATTGPASTISSVSSSWTIPRVSCLVGQYRNQDAFLAQWVGLDGYTDGTVEQLGTATQCYEGVEYYYVWYEMFPAGTVEEGTTQCINNNVDCPEPGDRVQASVVSTPGTGGNNNYTLKLTDFSNPSESFDVANQPCPATTCLNTSAEWIVERPAFDLPFGFQILPQADYGQTSFQNGTLGIGNRVTTIDRYPGTVNDIAMIDDSLSYYLSCPGQNGPPGQLLLFPQTASSPNPCGPTNAWGGNFSDTWDSSF